jgi:AcrR family transcriptional regulator
MAPIESLRKPRVKPKTRWGDRPQRRQDIIEAAQRLLDKRGFDGLYMRDVGRLAGVSAGLVYTYFGSREELFAALYAARLERLDAEIALLCKKARTPEELLVGIADRYRDIYRVFGRQLSLWTVLMSTGRYAPEVAAPLAQAASRVIASVHAALERCAAARGLKLSQLSDGELALPIMWAMLTGLSDHFESPRHQLHGYNWDALVRFAARVLVAGLTSLGATPPARGRRRRVGATTHARRR